MDCHWPTPNTHDLPGAEVSGRLLATNWLTSRLSAARDRDHAATRGAAGAPRAPRCRAVSLTLISALSSFAPYCNARLSATIPDRVTLRQGSPNPSL